MLDIFPVPKHIKKNGGHHPANTPPSLEISDLPTAEAYTLDITPDRIRIAGDEQGLRHGQATLRQIREQAGGGPLPCLEIRDEPSLRSIEFYRISARATPGCASASETS